MGISHCLSSHLEDMGKSACVTTHAISERYELATTIRWKSSLCCRMDFRGLDNYTAELHRMALAACYDMMTASCIDLHM